MKNSLKHLRLLCWHLDDTCILNCVTSMPSYYGHSCLQNKYYTLKGGPSDLGMKILQKYLKITLILPKPFDFPS